MHTSTVKLFDKHIESAVFYGNSFHFHAPSEHSIDGELMDLEMHVVHEMETKRNPLYNCFTASQFSAGVIGFMFKVMPDSFFDSVQLFGKDYQIEDVEYHDLFLSNLVEEEHSRSLLPHEQEEHQTRP